MPEFPYSLKGRVIHGRSQAGYDVRIKDEPWRRQQATYYDHETGPPGYGRPLTDEERRVKHYATYGTTQLPPRGTGLQRPMVAVGGRPVGRQQFIIDPFWGGVILGAVITLLLVTATGKAILSSAGYRVAKKIRGK